MGFTEQPIIGPIKFKIAISQRRSSAVTERPHDSDVSCHWIFR